METVIHSSRDGIVRHYQLEKSVHVNTEISSECWIGAAAEESSRRLFIKRMTYGDNKVLHNMAVKEYEAMCRVREVVKNIPEVYDFWDDKSGKCIYIVMEHIGGLTLDKWLERHRKDVLTPQFVKYRFGFIWELCRMLNAVNIRYKGVIVHKDLKPENIMLVNKKGRTDIVLLDFGTALTSNVRNIGTPGYQAPEQQGRRGTSVSITCKTDIFAIGQIIFELMTGEVPLPDIDYIVSPGERKWSRMPSVTEKVPGLPFGKDIDALVHNMVMYDPAERCGYTDIMSELRRIFRFGQR